MAAFDIINPDRELSREAKLVKEKSKKEQETMEFHLRRIKGNLEAKTMPEFNPQLSAKLDNVQLFLDLLEHPETKKKDEP
jgi:hypothetical protein